MEQTLAGDVLNALTAHIAILNAEGYVVAVNDKWKRFAHENGGDERTFYLGVSYLSVCEEAARRGEEGVARSMHRALLELLHGKRESFSAEYPCHSPAEQRWFLANVTRFTHRDTLFLAVAHEDITTRKQAENRLVETETTLRNVLEALPVGVWIMDASGKIVYGNSAGRKIWSGAQYVGPEQFGEYKGWWLSTGRRIEPDEWAAARAIQKGEISINEEVRIEAFDGSSKIILNSALPLRDADGRINGAIIVNQDITASKHSEDQLREASAAIDTINQELQRVLAREQRKARTDELTGLNNRRHFFELAQRLFSAAQRYQTAFSVLIFDVDHFKQINDTFGHQTGDAVLKGLARIAGEHVRESDVLARYGGEEFIMALPNTGAREAYRAIENIRETIAGTREIAGDMRVTVSAGVAEMTPGKDSLERVIWRADRALYEAKRAGRNCSRVYAAASKPG